MSLFQTHKSKRTSKSHHIIVN